MTKIVIKDSPLKRGTPSGNDHIDIFRVFIPLCANFQRLAFPVLLLDTYII